MIRPEVLSPAGDMECLESALKFGADAVFLAKKPWPGLAGQCLHARRLSFVHPRTGERVMLECPLPDWFEAVLTKLRSMA